MFKENQDFFPTPKSLQQKMLSKIKNWKYISTILEPSAGRGDLVDGITEKLKYHQSYKRSFDIDTIELDESLSHILRGNGHRVVHDNFLTFNTYKRYDAIIANFPFSQGEHHLKHAIELLERQKGGELVCLVNAETLRNPYTNVRKELLQKLEKYNAEIEYIEDAFVNSERQTSVETAIIYIHIEKIEHNSVIMESLKKEEIHNHNSSYNNDQLIDSDFIKGIVSQYEYEVKAGLKLIEEYNSLKPLMLGSFEDNSRPVLKLDLYYRDDDSTLENGYIRQIRLKYWKALFSNDQFMGLFTSNLRQKYMQHVQELQDYDFSLYNIYTLRIQISKEMVQGVEDTILDLFEEFSHKHYYSETSGNIHYYNGWKTNKSYKINKRVIIPLNAYSWYDGSFKPTDYTVLDKLKDIEKVFNYLDDGRTEDVDITEVLKMAEHYGDTRKIETKYVNLSFYKKGTCHLEFKDMELLHKLNLTAARHKNWLPPSYGNVRYEDMTREERATVDEFEGKESYDKVMSDKGYYITNTENMLLLTS